MIAANVAYPTMKNTAFLTLLGIGLLSVSAHAQEAATIPEGYVTINIAAGTGTTKTVTPLSIPTLDTATATGQTSGIITSVTSNTIGNSSAGWTPGQLSNAPSPYLIRITSGAAAGRSFLISTTTASTGTVVTIDPTETIHTPNLTTLGIVINTDTYQLIPCDTLSSLFGTPATTGIKSGTSAAVADSIILNVNGALSTYYYHSTLNRWTRSTLGTPDSTNVAVRPDAGIVFSRLGNTSIVLMPLGRVPSIVRKAVVNNTGTTYLSQGWPSNIILSATGIESMPNWKSSASVASADTVQIMVAGQWRVYWHDGTNWRRQTLGSPISDSQVISAGANIIINKKGTQSGTSILAQNLPYNLN